MFKRSIFITLLFFSLSANAAPYVSFLYGINSYTDEKKNTYDFTLRGSPLKLIVGQRYAHLEFELFTRFSNSSGNFVHDSLQNKIKQNSKMFGGGIGVYLFPALKINIGISVNSVKESLSTAISDIENNDIENKIGLSDTLLLGPYFGADLNIFKLGKVKFYATVNYYRFSNVGGSEIELALGVKIPFSESSYGHFNFDPSKVMSH